MLMAIWTTKDIVQKAKDNKQDAIAITDLNSGYGLLEFYEKTKGIKPILGTDIYFSYDSKTFMNIVLLAKNYQWYRNIIKLISIANTENIKQTPYIKMEDLKKYSDGIIALSWWNGEIEKLIISQEPKELILDKISEYEEIFNWEFYLEFITYDYKTISERKKIEEIFLEYIKEYMVDANSILTKKWGFNNWKIKSTSYRIKRSICSVLICIFKYLDNTLYACWFSDNCNRSICF